MTQEESRLQEARKGTSQLEEVGALPQRATVGNGARGL